MEYILVLLNLLNVPYKTRILPHFTRKLSYREDESAMRPMCMGALKIFECPWVRQRLRLPKFLMDFCSDRSYEYVSTEFKFVTLPVPEIIRGT